MDCSDDISILDGTAPPSPETVHEDTSKGGGIALFNPCGLAVSATGRVYIADTGHHRVCVLDGDCLRVLAGSGARGYADGQGVPRDDAEAVRWFLAAYFQSVPSAVRSSAL